MKEIHIKIIDKMKSLLFLYFCVAMAFSAMASSVSDTYVIPNPQQMVCGDGILCFVHRHLSPVT